MDGTAAFYWSIVTPLQQDWRERVRRAVRGVSGVQVRTTPAYIEIFTEAKPAERWQANIRFDLIGNRGGGVVASSTDDLLILMGLKIADVLDFDLSDDAGVSLPRGQPLQWLAQVGLKRPAIEVEALAVEIGLIAKRYSLAELTRPDVDKETQLFF
jgi:hypothetical protein